MNNVIYLSTYKPETARRVHNESVLRNYKIEKKDKETFNNIIRASPLFKNSHVKKIVQACKALNIKVNFRLDVSGDYVAAVFIDIQKDTFIFTEPAEAWLFLCNLRNK